MPTTDNGWDARPDLSLRPLVIAGEAFSPGIVDNDDVHTVLGYVLQQMHERVEPVVRSDWHQADDWGFSYRENRNANSLSRHSGGIAADYNATRHPNGVPTYKTFTADQIREVHKILAEVDHAVRWGGDYSGTPDAMHFEINTTPAGLRPIADRLREAHDMNATQDQRLKDVEQAVDRLEDKLDTVLNVVRKKGSNAWERDVDLKKLVKAVLAEVSDKP